jgi:hypothetical protein
MDFQTFKKEKLNEILNQFLDPNIVNSYRAEYGIQRGDFENDISSYDDVYNILGYAFLILGRAIAKTISDVRVYESGSSENRSSESGPSKNNSFPMKRFSLDDKESLIHGAWYWVFNFKPDGVTVLPPVPVQYFSNKSLLECLPRSISPATNSKPDIGGVIIFGPIPFPELRGEISPIISALLAKTAPAYSEKYNENTKR